MYRTILQAWLSVLLNFIETVFIAATDDVSLFIIKFAQLLLFIFFLHIMLVTEPVIVWQQISMNLKFRFYIWASNKEKLVFQFFMNIVSVLIEW
jgi:hypothetical protein